MQAFAPTPSTLRDVFASFYRFLLASRPNCLRIRTPTSPCGALLLLPDSTVKSSGSVAGVPILGISRPYTQQRIVLTVERSGTLPRHRYYP